VYISSPNRNWPHLGAIFFRNYTRQLLSGGGKRFRRSYWWISVIPSNEVGVPNLTIILKMTPDDGFVDGGKTIQTSQLLRMP
jgi:hypothetical protein